MSAFTPRAPTVTTVVEPSTYTLPIASLSVLGGVKVSTDFDIDGSGVLTLKRQSFQFQTGLATPSYSKGNTYWDESNQTLSTDLANNVRLQHGQEIHIIATNVTGSTISNGKCVYISGASGDHPTVALARADSLLTSDSLIGIATQDILDTESGYITLMGKVRNLDTSAFSVGPVYISASTAGAFTGTRPAYPNRAIRVGFVTAVSATVGTVLVDIEDYADAQDILLPASGTPTEVVDVLDWFRHSWSTGLADGGALTNNGDGTINIAASDFLLRQGPSDDSPLVVYRDAGATNLAIPANDVSYVYLNYNSGTPTWTASASLSDFNGIDKVITYIVARNGSRLNVVDLRGINIDSGRKSRRQKVEFDGFVYKGWWRSSLSTSALSSSGLNLLVGTGRYYYFDNPISHGAFDTSVAGTADANTFIYFYNRTGTWSQLIEQKTVNATQYDVAGTLTTMTNNRYRTDWVYAVMCAATSNCYLVSILGNAEYASLAAAQAAPLPSTLPPQIDGISVLIGQVVIQKSAATVTIQTAGGVAFTGGVPASDHNSLPGLQGGAATEYYHLTSAQHTVATQAASSTLSGYLSSTDWSTFHAKQPAGSYEVTSAKGAANGYAPLGADSKIPSTYIPALAITEYLGNFADTTAALADAGVQASQKGDWFTVSTSGGETWIVTTDSPTLLAHITKIASPTDVVTSVNGQTGVVSLTKADIGLGNHNNPPHSLTFTTSGTTTLSVPTTGTLATLAGIEEFTNKTLNASVGKGTWTASGTWTLPALTLGGNVSSTGNPSLNIGTGTLTAGSGTFRLTGTTTGEILSVGNATSGRYGGIGFVEVGTDANDYIYLSGPLGNQDVKIYGSGNVTLGDASTDTVTVNGYMGVGTTPQPYHAINVGLSKTISGDANPSGIYSAATFQSDVTGHARAFMGLIRTQATAFTMANGSAFYAGNASKGAGSTITNLHGIYIDDQAQGTNNYGITSAVSSGTNKWNIYASGTAANYFAGSVVIGSTESLVGTLIANADYTTAYTADLTTNAAIKGFGSQLTIQSTVNTSSVSGITLMTRSTGLSRWDILNVWTSTYLGDLVFRRRTAGSNTAEALRIDSSGNSLFNQATAGTSAAGVIAIKTGTAPTTGPADTVSFYSSDNSAGHTIPSFFCEGTEVLATGQADSASSVRVKMRINGTVVTLLAI